MWSKTRDASKVPGHQEGLKFFSHLSVSPQVEPPKGMIPDRSPFHDDPPHASQICRAGVSPLAVRADSPGLGQDHHPHNLVSSFENISTHILPPRKDFADATTTLFVVVILAVSPFHPHLRKQGDALVAEHRG